MSAIPAFSSWSSSFPSNTFLYGIFEFRYAFIDVSGTGMDGNQFADDMIENAHVIVVPGDTFGTEGKKYVRLVFATSEANIREGIRRIGKRMEEIMK